MSARPRRCAMPMTDSEYQTTQDLLLNVAHLASMLDTEAFLQRIEEAESLGPLLDPTGYRNARAQGGMKKLATIKRLAKAAKDMKHALVEAGQGVVRHA